MCAGKSCEQPTDASSVMGKPVRSMYRVLRGVSRGTLRSVDRDHAGRNAPSVKGLSPVKNQCLWWPSNYIAAKAAPVIVEIMGTTGVRDHGMYERLFTEPRRSFRSRRRIFRTEWQGPNTKSLSILREEVRCSHISEEVG